MLNLSTKLPLLLAFTFLTFFISLSSAYATRHLVMHSDSTYDVQVSMHPSASILLSAVHIDCNNEKKVQVYNGTTYQPDTLSNDYFSVGAIANTNYPEFFQDFLYTQGRISRTHALADGNYVLYLYLRASADNASLLDVGINGVVRERNLNVSVAAGGANRALIVAYNFTATGGQFTFSLNAASGYGQLAGYDVLLAGTPSPLANSVAARELGGKTIVFCGTSRTFAVNATATTRWTYLLCQEHNGVEDNQGVPGVTLAEYELTRIPTHTSAHRMLVAEFGTNEFRRGTINGNYYPTLRLQYLAFINNALSKGWAASDILLQSCYYPACANPEELPAFAAFLKSVCQETKTRYVPFYEYFSARPNVAQLFTDGVHENGTTGQWALKEFYESQL